MLTSCYSSTIPSVLSIEWIGKLVRLFATFILAQETEFFVSGSGNLSAFE